MKQFVIGLLVLCFAGVWFPAAAADKTMIELSPEETVSSEMIDVLVQNLDNLIPITSQRQIFLNPSEALYSDVGTETMVRTETDLGKRNITIFANSDSVHDYSVYDKLDDAYPTNFQMTMDVTVQDVFPENEGGCFIGFTNYGISAFSGDADAVFIHMLITGTASEIYVKPADADAGGHLLLGNSNRKTAKLSIIHMTEHTFVFLNGVYVGQYHDGAKGPFQMIYGAAVFSDGDTASCTFDNLVVRKVHH